MAQYSIYLLVDGSGHVIDPQSPAVDYLNTRIDAPIYKKSEYTLSFYRSNPEFEIGGQTYVVLTHFLATVHRSELCKVVADLSKEDHRISSGLYLVLRGVSLLFQVEATFICTLGVERG